MTKKNHSIAIIVVAYNRLNSLLRLLHSILNSDFTNYNNIPLIVSIDYSGEDICYKTAEDFEWQFGDKILIKHQYNLGLKNHIISCGDLVKDYDAVILLEDDLVVSPCFYSYCQQAYEYFNGDNRIGGISLYGYSYNEFAKVPFTPIHTGFDNYFMQVPSSCGEMWTKSQWANFKKFYESNPPIMNSDLLPDDVISNWPDSSWKKLFYKFLCVKDKYFVYPYVSLTTNMGEVGEHYDFPVNKWQVPLQHNKTAYNFCSLGDTIAVYDYAFEFHGDGLKSLFNDKSIELDLYGTKNLSKIQAEFIISLKECKNPMLQFGADLIPEVNNILFNIPGNVYSYAKVKDFTNNKVLEKLVELDISKCSPMAIEYTNKKAFAKGLTSVYSTRSYKIGHFLLNPLKKIRDFHFGRNRQQTFHK